MTINEKDFCKALENPNVRSTLRRIFTGLLEESIGFNHLHPKVQLKDALNKMFEAAHEYFTYIDSADAYWMHFPGLRGIQDVEVSIEKGTGYENAEKLRLETRVLVFKRKNAKETEGNKND